MSAITHRRQWAGIGDPSLINFLRHGTVPACGVPKGSVISVSVFPRIGGLTSNLKLLEGQGKTKSTRTVYQSWTQRNNKGTVIRYPVMI